MYKIFTDINFLIPEYRSRVFPLLFDLCYVFDKHVTSVFKLVDTMEEADFAIFPIDINFLYNIKKKKIVKDFIYQAKLRKKQVWVYSGGDFGISIDEEIVTFRFGGFDSKLSNSTYIMPCFINDPLEKYEELTFEVIQKKEKPLIGFVGNADGSFLKKCKELTIYIKQNLTRVLKKDATDFQFFYPSSIKRFSLLEELRHDKEIEADFIYRKKYRAGVKTNDERRKTELEFYNNIKQNLYTFCLRGSGNFSVRFYETLIMGRIPVLIDTDVRLPLSHIIDWNKHIVKVNEEHLIESLVNFHNKKSKEELEEIQKENRKLGLTMLNRSSYFEIMANYLKK